MTLNLLKSIEINGNRCTLKSHHKFNYLSQYSQAHSLQSTVFSCSIVFMMSSQAAYPPVTRYFSCSLSGASLPSMRLSQLCCGGALVQSAKKPQMKTSSPGRAVSLPQQRAGASLQMLPPASPSPASPTPGPVSRRHRNTRETGGCRYGVFLPSVL